MIVDYAYTIQPLLVDDDGGFYYPMYWGFFNNRIDGYKTKIWVN